MKKSENNFSGWIKTITIAGVLIGSPVQAVTLLDPDAPASPPPKKPIKWGSVPFLGEKPGAPKENKVIQDEKSKPDKNTETSATAQPLPNELSDVSKNVTSMETSEAPVTEPPADSEDFTRGY